MKKWLFQVILMTLLVASSMVLNMMMLCYCVEHNNIEYTHVAFSALFQFCGMVGLRIMYQLAQKHREEEEYIQHQLDMADDYASREY